MRASARNKRVSAPGSTGSEGLFARMFRLWIEQNERMLDHGIRQF